MSALRAFSVLALLSLWTGCSKGPDLAASKDVQDDPAVFKYPGNWKMEKAREAQEGVTTTTYTIEPSDGLAMIIVFAPAIELDLEAFAADMLKNMDDSLKQDYSLGSIEVLKKMDGKKEPVTRKISGAERHGLNIKVTLTAMGTKVPLTLEIYRVEGEATSAIALYQTADEDAARDQPGYNLIFDTLTIK
jgi:hypothetical protein